MAIEWFTVTFDDQQVHLDVRPPGESPWQDAVAWADLIRICFKAEDFLVSDGLYLFSSQRPESYAIPSEAIGGAELWGEILRRGLFDAELAIEAASAIEGLFCWPPPEQR